MSVRDSCCAIMWISWEVNHQCLMWTSIEVSHPIRRSAKAASLALEAATYLESPVR